MILLLASSLALFSSHDPETKVEHLQMFSERCSGSNYVEELLRKNIVSFSPIHSQAYGHKHFPPYYQLPLSYWDGPQHHYTLEDSESTLFLILFRNPYDWIRSLNRLPWVAHGDLWWQPFSSFIRAPWVLQETELFSPSTDLNPDTHEVHSNALQLRSTKIKTMLMLNDLAKNVYFVQYEKVCEDPEAFLQEIAEIFGLQRIEPYVSISTYKGIHNLPYQKKEYVSISKEDLEWINSQLDPELEAEIGYQLVTDPQEVP